MPVSFFRAARLPKSLKRLRKHVRRNPADNQAQQAFAKRLDMIWDKRQYDSIKSKEGWFIIDEAKMLSETEDGPLLHDASLTPPDWAVSIWHSARHE